MSAKKIVENNLLTLNRRFHILSTQRVTLVLTIYSGVMKGGETLCKVA